MPSDCYQRCDKCTQQSITATDATTQHYIQAAAHTSIHRQISHIIYAFNIAIYSVSLQCSILQCFDAVASATGMASGL